MLKYYDFFELEDLHQSTLLTSSKFVDNVGTSSSFSFSGIVSGCFESLAP